MAEQEFNDNEEYKNEESLREGEEDFVDEASAGENPDDSQVATGRFGHITNIDDGKTHRLSGMFRDWFLDYASYVILERAVPHIEDGLKPVQRRILHAMQRLDDGRFNKVANIIGFTMQFHPHGDASIGDALVQLGQKELLIETQGNFGNILTGDGAAAPRYIEARLSKFALETVFNPKTTEWMNSYDGRNKEPVTLPVKFPLLLAQGVEGIAVGLSSKILPHNFNELIDASIACLKGEDFTILPDFPTGGLVDANNYNDGKRGGRVKVRARINKIDNRMLAITEIPFGMDTSRLIDSIVKANDKGKIKIKKVDDNTARNAEILIQPAADVSPDMTIDALYAFTDCEVSLAVYACVIIDDKPAFIGVKDILRANTEQTKDLLRRELEIRLNELDEDWHYSSLEKIFFEERIYRELEKDSASWNDQLAAIGRAFEPFKARLKRKITQEDIIKLTEKPVRRISKFDIKKAEEHIKNVEEEMERVKANLDKLVQYAIDYFRHIKKKYGAGRERRTELRNFDTIEAVQVVQANEKLYVNMKEGFVGYGMKRDEDAQYLCDCSDLDEIIAFFKSGKYIITKASEKAFLGKDLMYVNVFRRNDTRTVYNMVYRDGRNGPIMMKRFAVSNIVRDREYDATKGTEHSQVMHFSANRNGEAEVLKVFFRPRQRMKKLVEELDFAKLEVRGRNAAGNIFSRNAIHKVVVKEKGVSTLGGQKIWLDKETSKLNADERGEYIGEFFGDDKILAISKQGSYYTTNYELVNRYEDMILVQKFDPRRVFSALYFDAEQSYFYLKRFTFEPSSLPEKFIDEHPDSYLVELSQDEFPQIELTFGGKRHRRPERVDVEEFIAVKSHRAKGKRLSQAGVEGVKFVEPLEKEITIKENIPAEPHKPEQMSLNLPD
ncbi:MAG: DNA gyrase/topoisomerase IV subunit A [Prevotellaceae bacterium]|jgi:topoisomerase-4 subunit A|nr:DNA gyrase/topoisomerase IV subunit A [Prevotellaceae bacterium]